MLPATAPLYTHNQQPMHHNSHLHQQQNHQQTHHPHQPQMQTPPQGPPIYPYQQPFPPQPLTPQQMQQQQFAQWAYQNMMFNAQQQHQLAAFQLNGPMAQSAAFDPRFQQQQQMQLAQMHQQQLAALQHQQQHHFPQPPYARESNGSRSSLNSSNGSSRSQDAVPGRRRTPSNRSNSAPVPHPSPYPPGTRIIGSAINQGRSSPGPLAHQRVSSTSSHGSANSSPSPAATALAAVAARSQSQTPPSSGTSSLSGSPNSFSPPNGSKANSPRAPSKPSPLSQGSSPLARVQDDGDLTDTPTPMMIKSGGLKGRLRRALSFSAVNSLESTSDNGEEKLGSRRKVVAAKLTSEGQTPVRSSQSRPSTDSTSTLRHGPPAASGTPDQTIPTDPSIRSINTNGKKKGRSLFNAKFNASTDNISLSSTVSSASVMIRKLGSVGQLARRNSLMKISNLFKDKEKKRAEAEAAAANSDGEAGTTKGKSAAKPKKTAKSDKAEASVTHATVELESGTNGRTADDMVGLSPAAKLARQHTLRSKAQEAARARSEKEQKEKEGGDGKTPTTWEKNTATRATGKKLHSRQTSSQHQHASDEDILEGSDEDGTYDGQHGSAGPQPPALGYHRQAEEDDSGSDHDYGNNFEDEDNTVTLGQSADMDEPWAVGIRRSVERSRTPCKGILKYADSYDQSNYLADPPQAPYTRTRSNSYDSAPPNGTEPGPLARIPSPDPDHIDGLHHRSNSSDHHRSGSSSSAKPSFLPPLKFDDASSSPLASALTFDDSGPTTPKEKSKRDSASSGTFSYQQPSFNASAPALATSSSAASNKRPSNAAQRSATAPLALNSRKLTFAANLSVYHTFSPTVYDRRSEPATCNRLTPALAQRIKEELNNYKMEEMEVHHMSRAHTHFFV